MTSTVRQLLQVKGSGVYSVSPEATVYQALEEMSQCDVGALLVIDKGKLVGIFSERDYARKVILMGRFSKDTLVKDVMTEELIYVGPEATVGDCMALMTDKRVRHLPVMEEGKLLGIISIGDVVKSIMKEQELFIAEMEHYITGSR